MNLSFPRNFLFWRKLTQPKVNAAQDSSDFKKRKKKGSISQKRTLLYFEIKKWKLLLELDSTKPTLP